MSNNMFSRNVNKKWLINNDERPVNGNKIVLGVILPAVSYQPKEFGASQVITAKSNWLNKKNGIFISSLMHKLMHQFSYQNKPGINIYKNMNILLPIKNSKIDFDFMENFIAELEAERIAELEAYLSVTGLKNTELTSEEQKALNDFKRDNIVWDEIRYQDIFNKIQQGKRLKKSDQLEGNIPFVMSGVTNTGIVNYISNPVSFFQKNAITIDIFGNTFYRNYNFGAGDDTGVYYNDHNNYSQKVMLFFATSMGKSILGKFSYGKKLRSSQSKNFKMKIPITQNNQPDFSSMSTLIFAIQKLVIKDVVNYADEKIATTKHVVKDTQLPDLV